MREISSILVGGVSLFFAFCAILRRLAFHASCVKRNIRKASRSFDAQLRVLTRFWGIGGSAIQQARSIEGPRCTACERTNQHILDYLRDLFLSCICLRFYENLEFEFEIYLEVRFFGQDNRYYSHMIRVGFPKT